MSETVPSNDEALPIYEALGGESTLVVAVPHFYEKVCADPRVAHFFEGLDMNAQSAKQLAFMARAFGGPEEYHGRDLATAHAALVRDKGLCDEYFDAIAELLGETLSELGVDEALAERVLTAVGSLRSEVLSGTPK